MMSTVNKEFEVSINSDASGSWGCGALNGRETEVGGAWFQQGIQHHNQRAPTHCDSSAIGIRVVR